MSLPKVMKKLLCLKDDIPFGWLKEIGQLRTFQQLDTRVSSLERMYMDNRKKLNEEFAYLDETIELFEMYLSIHKAYWSGQSGGAVIQ